MKFIQQNEDLLAIGLAIFMMSSLVWVYQATTLFKLGTDVSASAEQAKTKHPPSIDDLLNQLGGM